MVCELHYILYFSENHSFLALLFHTSVPYFIGDFLTAILSVAAMSWVAEYLLVLLVIYDFTTFGRNARRLTQTVHNLVHDKINESNGRKEQLKVIYTQHMLQCNRSVCATNRSIGVYYTFKCLKINCNIKHV